MDNPVLEDGAPKADVHHKPRHLAEKFESYVGVGMVIVAAVLLVILIYAFSQTGSGTPSWMVK